MFIVTQGIIPFIIIGLVAGWIFGLLIKSRGFSVLGDIILGIIGAVIGGFIIGALSGIGLPFSRIDLVTIAVAIAGAVFTVGIANAINRYVRTRA